jgi:hypothetical protein
MMNRRSVMIRSALLVLGTATTQGNAAVPSNTSVVRVSLGRYPPAKVTEVAAIMDYEGKPLGRAIKGLPGLISYYSGIDRARHALVNVSVWKDSASAEQMETLQLMLDQGKALAALGVKFERPIPNFATLWSA